MAISFVGKTNNSGATATLPTGWQAGDLALAYAYRDGSNTPPSLPTGWTDIHNSGANTNSHRLAYRVLQAGDSSWTFTNATETIVHVYRGQQAATPIGASAATGANNSTTVTYSALTLQVTDGTSWVAGFAGHRSTNTALETPPTGMVNRSNIVDATAEAAGHDTNGGVSSWSSQDVAVGGTASAWRSIVVEIRGAANFVDLDATFTITGVITPGPSAQMAVAATMTPVASVTASTSVQYGLAMTSAGTVTLGATLGVTRPLEALMTVSGAMSAAVETVPFRDLEWQSAVASTVDVSISRFGNLAFSIPSSTALEITISSANVTLFDLALSSQMAMAASVAPQRSLGSSLSASVTMSVAPGVVHSLIVPMAISSALGVNLRTIKSVQSSLLSSTNIGVTISPRVGLSATISVRTW